MKRPSTRRTFLTTLGAGATLSLAGCSGILGSGDNSGSDGSHFTPPTIDAPNVGTTTETNGTATATETQTPQPTNIPFSRGEVVEGFEENLAHWRALSGKVTIDRENPYQGKRSLVLLGENNGKTTAATPTQTTNGTNTTDTTNTTATPTQIPNTAGIARSYSMGNKSSGIDLRKHDLTMAVRFEKPVHGRIGVELVAPTKSMSLTSRHFIPKELNGWTRIDLGYTGKEGKPSLKNVLGLRIIVNTVGDPIKVSVDDIRKIPKAKKGKVMFQFDDSHITAFTEAFPRLKQRNWAGGVAVIPESVGTPENLTWTQIREMNSAGWDAMSHPPVAKPLPQYSAKKQDQVIQETKKALTRRGFTKGARHIVAPYGRVSNKTIEIMQKYHETNYMFGGSPSNAKHPSNMYAISRVFGTAPMDALRSLLDLTEQYNQMLVIFYHDIGTNTDSSASIEHFENVLNYVGTKDVDVVSPSQFLDSIGK